MDDILVSLLPTGATVGGGGLIIALVHRFLALEKKCQQMEIELTKLRNSYFIYYMYFSKKDTNFAVFVEKHTPNTNLR